MATKTWRSLAAVGGLSMLAAALAGCGAQARPAPPALRPLDALAQRRLFFGHQSVGDDILEGVGRELAARGAAAPRVMELAEGAELPAGTLAHRKLGRNEAPLSKLEAFAQQLERTPQVDVAFLKFCYVDIDARTDVAALFARYRATFQALEARHPRTTFVHFTVPLTTVQRGPGAWLEVLRGSAPWGAEENARREAFNALLRSSYAGKAPVFDLARLEATAPDGSAERFEHAGASHPALVPAYTEDGSHLNAEGQAWVARHLLDFLAALPARAGEG